MVPSPLRLSRIVPTTPSAMSTNPTTAIPPSRSRKRARNSVTGGGAVGSGLGIASYPFVRGGTFIPRPSDAGRVRTAAAPRGPRTDVDALRLSRRRRFSSSPLDPAADVQGRRLSDGRGRTDSRGAVHLAEGPRLAHRAGEPAGLAPGTEPVARDGGVGGGLGS